MTLNESYELFQSTLLSLFNDLFPLQSNKNLTKVTRDTREQYYRTRLETSIGNSKKIIMKQFETILFPRDMIQEIYKLHWNIIHKSIGVT